jgi:hypothetical protein
VHDLELALERARVNERSLAARLLR